MPQLALAFGPGDGGPQVHAVDGTLVLADLSGFTAMSERLGSRGRVGAEEVTDVVSATFAELLAGAWALGGGLLHFGGDAVLLAFSGSGHTERAVAAAAEMRQTLRRLGQVATSAGTVRLRMSIGVHSGRLTFFVVGRSSRELVVAGPGATSVVRMEAAASAGQVLLSPEAAAALPPRCTGDAVGPGVLLARRPGAPAPPPAPAPIAAADAGTFLPTALREHLAAGGGESEHRQAAVAFVHIGGGDGVAVRDGEEELAARLDAAIGAVQEACDELGASYLATDVYDGATKILLTAGVPTARGGDEDRLLRVARAVVATDCGLTIRAGVHAGPVFAGVVGARFRKAYTVMGDVANTAARVAAHAHWGEVLATRAVLDRCVTRFQRTPRPAFAAKGKARLLEADAVGPVVERGSDTNGASLHRWPLLGREQELESLTAAIESLRSDGGQAIAVVADPGAGVTRLLDEAERRSDMRWVRATAHAADADLAFSAVRPVVRSVLGLPSLPDPNDGIALSELVAGVSADALPWLPLVATVAGVVVPATPEAAALEPRGRSARLRATLIRLLAAVIDSPTVIVLEHLDVADSASADLLAGIRTGLGRMPVAIVTSSASAPPWPAAHVAVPPLPRRTAVELAVLAGDRRVLGHQAAVIAARAGGVPALVVALAAAVAGGADLDSLPAGLEALAASRIDALAPADRSAIRALAVLGSSFPVADAAIVVDGDLDDLWSRLAGLVEVTDGIVRFTATVVRDAAYEGLSHRRRVELHGRLADTLAATEAAGARADVLAVHADVAGRHELCWRSARTAAARAEATGSWSVVAVLLERAVRSAAFVPSVEDAELGAAFDRLGTALWVLGDYRAAELALHRAERLLVSSPTARADALLRLGLTAELQGRRLAASRRLHRGLRVLAGRQDPEAARIGLRLRLGIAQVRREQGRAQETLRIAESAREEAERAGDATGVGHALTYIANALGALGRPGALEASRAAAAAFEAAGDLRTMAIGWLNVGVACEQAEAYQDALDASERAEAGATEAGDASVAAVAQANRATTLLYLGRVAEAERAVAASWAVLAAGRSIFAPHACLLLAETLALLGRVADAEQTMAQLDLQVGANDPRYADERVFVAARIALAGGRFEEALELAAASSHSRMACIRARALRGLGRDAEALAEAQAALAAAEQAGLRIDVVRARATLAYVDGDRASVRRARDMQKELGIVWLDPLDGPDVLPDAVTPVLTVAAQE